MQLIVEECEERMSEQQVEEFIQIINQYLPIVQRFLGFSLIYLNFIFKRLILQINQETFVDENATNKSSVTEESKDDEIIEEE